MAVNLSWEETVIICYLSFPISYEISIIVLNPLTVNVPLT